MKSKHLAVPLLASLSVLTGGIVVVLNRNDCPAHNDKVFANVRSWKQLPHFCLFQDLVTHTVKTDPAASVLKEHFYQGLRIA